MLIILLVILAAWEVYWTYHACWIASKLNEKKSFLFFLIFNLLGIPEIIYIYRKKKEYTNLNEIMDDAKKYLSFEKDKNE